ncbi:hypothetical protein [Halomonas alkalicola]|uniref:hypothetical protein n=1 Tax=Halomonas alkalicola TaxID=1930622 RepID=UPI00265EFF4F|nr:hypothetical protein [Halomonas alkalicola]
MPRNSWTSLLDDSPPAEPEVPELPPEVARLQAERAALEARMAALTGRGEEVPGEAARFPVTPLDQRRRADDAWARQRDGRPDPRPALGRLGLGSGSGQRDAAEQEPEARSGQRAILAPRERSLAERLFTGRPMGQGSMLAEADGLLRGRASGVEERWRERGGAEQAYRARRERLLSVAEGGSGDLDARAERARERALEARRLARQREEADDRRLRRSRYRERGANDETTSGEMP